MRQADTAFAHHGHQIAIAQLKTQIPTNAQQHDLLFKVPAFEQVLTPDQAGKSFLRCLACIVALLLSRNPENLCRIDSEVTLKALVISYK